MDDDKKDFSDELKNVLPAAQNLADGGDLDGAIEMCFSLEKKCRLGNDIPSIKELVVSMVKMCKESGNMEKLNATLTMISKRRAQLKQAILESVKEAYSYIDTVTDPAVRKELIITLRDITDGKIFIEAERARLTLMLSNILENEGDVKGACSIMQDVHVETYGSLTKKEKADFILDQMRLNLAMKDYVRLVIVSRKINKKNLEDEDFQEIKLKFYMLMTEYYTHEKDPWELCLCYHAMYNTKLVQDEKAKWVDALQSTIAYLLLSPHTNHQQDLLHRIALEKKLDDLPFYKGLVKTYTKHEIIGYPLPGFEQVTSLPCLQQGGPELFQKWSADFASRTIEHNIRVVARYYKQIKMDRLCSLLGLPADQIESHVSGMVSEHGLYARIDRPMGIVDFDKYKAPEEVLSDWNADISQLLSLVENTCYLINKECMINKVKL